MKKLHELTGLEKAANIELRYCNIIMDEQQELESGAWRRRVVEQDGRYFYHEMHNGVVKSCFEMALSWEPFENRKKFSYTLDDRHVCDMDVDTHGNRIVSVDARKLNREQVAPGDSCEYKGVKITYLAPDALNINGKTVKVEYDSRYVYNILKTKIKATGGAMGLFTWLEQTAEQSKHEAFPLWCGVFVVLAEKYK